jgi:APA family basic amino acid/polyamine antiporter
MAQLQRRLGLAALTFYGVGMILGAGVYSVIGAAAARADEALWQSFVAASIVALLTGLSYAELATMLPRTGAEHLYLSHAFPRRPLVAFLAGILLIVSACATAATVAVAFGGYLGELTGLPARASALTLLAVVTLVNLAGLRHAAGVTAAFTVVEAAGLVLIIVLGARTGEAGHALGAAPHAGVLAGAALLFFAYLGFEQIAGLAEETKDPGRNLPRAILWSVGITTILYVLVGLAVVALVPAAELAGTDAPLMKAAATASAGAARALGVIALFATANTALASLVAVSRLMHGMAREDALPPVLESVLPRRHVPWVAALASLGLAALLALPGDVKAIASLSSFGALLAFAAVHACVIVLRRKEPSTKRPFRVPLAVLGVPVPAALGLVLSLVLAAQFDRTTFLAGLATLLVGLLAWGARAIRKRHAAR